MKKTRRFYSATLAAIMSCCIGVSANAAEENLELISIPAPNGATIGGDGLVLRGDNGFEKFVIIDVDKWQTTGEFVYDEVSVDIDFSNLSSVVNFNGIDGYFTMKNGGTVSYIMKYNEDTMSAELVQSYDEWCSVTSDGYVITESDDKHMVSAPDGTKKIFLEEKHNVVVSPLVNNSDYIAFVSYSDTWETGEYIGNKFDLYDPTFALVDKQGVIEIIDNWDDLAYCTYFGNVKKFENGLLYMTSSVGMGQNYRVFCTDNKEIYDLDSDVEYTNIIASNLNTINGNLYDGRFIGEYINHDTGEKSYALVDAESSTFISDLYSSMSTNDGEIFLINSDDGKYGYMNSDGEVLAMFDDAGGFIGEYAPVIRDGKAYLIDRNMEIVSEGVEADSVSTLYADVFYYESGDDSYFMTYAEAKTSDTPTEDTGDTSDQQPAPDTDEGGEDSAQGDDTASDIPTEDETGNDDVASDNTDEDANKDDTDSTGDTDDKDDKDKTSAETGAEGVAVAAAIALTAVGAAVLSRRKR